MMVFMSLLMACFPNQLLKNQYIFEIKTNETNENMPTKNIFSLNHNNNFRFTKEILMLYN